MKKDLIEEFFKKQLVTTYHTRKSYRGNINKYFSLLNKDISTYFNKKKKLDEYDDDLNIVYMKLDKKKVPLLTRRTFFNAVKQFMCSTDKRLKQLDFWDTIKIRVRGADPISEKHQLNNLDIKTLLTHANTCVRAGGMIMATTGMRLGELLALTIEDIDTTVEPAIISIRGTYDPHEPDNIRIGTKTRKQRKCFITPEAVHCYNEWLKERDEYLRVSVLKSKYPKNPDDKRIFPMSDENFREMWVNTVKRSGLYKKDRRTDRLTLHPHCMRRFFRSYLGNSDLSEYLMGHSTGMDKYYYNMKLSDLAQEYTKVMYNLAIFEREPDISGMQTKLSDLEQKYEKSQYENKELQQQYVNLDHELLKTKFELGKEIERLRKKINKKR